MIGEIMNIMVTGGFGYIGSHVCVSLLNKGHKIIVVDNLSKSNIDVGEKIRAITNKDFIFYEIDITDYDELKNIFIEHSIDTIMHFAGYKSVSESLNKPIEYYENNLISTINLLRLSGEYNVNKFIFSSSATVYGDGVAPYTEESPLFKRTNPYGESKAMCERIIKDYSNASKNKSFIVFRYFNPVGAHSSGLIGEWTKDKPNNLMPFVTKVANKELERLDVFGDDYPTKDGTGVRDFIHIMDLAEGHVAAIEYDKEGYHVFNLGTGKGYSVLELINAFQKVNNIRVEYRIAPRRKGDIATSYADVTKAKLELKWSAKRDLEDMCRDSWNFVTRNI